MHGCVKLGNDPGIPELVVQAYAGKMAERCLEAAEDWNRATRVLPAKWGKST